MSLTTSQQAQLATTQLPDPLAFAVADPNTYADNEEMHRVLTEIRRAHPFAKSTLSNYEPFWVASKYEDIRQISRQNDVFLSGLFRPGTAGLTTKDVVEEERAAAGDVGISSVVRMNEPDHAKYRMLTQSWFTPQNIRPLMDNIRGLARVFIEKMRASSRVDFVHEVAVHFPLLVVMSILGLSPDDEPMMQRLTKEYFGKADRDLARRGAKTPEESAAGTMAGVRDYFEKVIADRRRNPTDDLVSVIVNGRIDGEYLPPDKALRYCITLIFAGNDTTASTISGGMWALAEHPEELAKVKADLALIPKLAEESLRWTSPVHHNMRTAAEDVEVRGCMVRKGEHIVLSYPSANRDEDAYEDPFAFRADRNPNRHLTFGHGIHQCLGMHLARMEMAIFFEELLPSLQALELDGAPTRTVSNFVGGPKYLPLRSAFA